MVATVVIDGTALLQRQQRK